MWKLAQLLTDTSPDGLAIQKESFNTHAAIMGRSAVFIYHRQLNRLHRVGVTVGDVDPEASRKRTKAQE